MKENREQNIALDQEMYIREYIEMIYNKKQYITIGRTQEGNFLLHTGDPKLTEQYKTMLIPEDTFVGLIVSAIVYFEHYDIDIIGKSKEIIGSELITYTFPSNTY